MSLLNSRPTKMATANPMIIRFWFMTSISLASLTSETVYLTELTVPIVPRRNKPVWIPLRPRQKAPSKGSSYLMKSWGLHAVQTKKNPGQGSTYYGVFLPLAGLATWPQSPSNLKPKDCQPIQIRTSRDLEKRLPHPSVSNPRHPVPAIRQAAAGGPAPDLLLQVRFWLRASRPPRCACRCRAGGLGRSANWESYVCENPPSRRVA